MTGQDLSGLRARYARELLASARTRHGRVEAAFAAVARERHLTPPPWRIFAPGGFMDDETSDPAKLYDDVLVVLDCGKGINNGQPSLHAAWMAALDPRPGERIVQIGIGAGYYTAILAELVGDGGRVEAYEIEPRLAAIARDNLGPLSQVTVHAASGVGAPLPEADVVYVSAAAAAPDPGWLRCLRPGGRLIFPWQPDPGHGIAAVVTRSPAGFGVELLSGVAFVACVGAPSGGAQPNRRRSAETRSIWLTDEAPPDETATGIYEEVWFSSRQLSADRQSG